MNRQLLSLSGWAGLLMVALLATLPLGSCKQVDDASESETPPQKEEAGGAASAEDTPTVPVQDGADPASDWIPWIVAIVMTALAGMAGTHALMLRKQGRHFDALRRRVIEEGEPVQLLTEEAATLVRDLHQEVVRRAADLEERTVAQKQELKEMLQRSEEEQRISRDQTDRVVTSFKTSLNGMLEKMQKFLSQVVQDTQASRAEAKETKDLVSGLADAIPAKDKEIAELRDAFHVKLIGPLAKSFLDVRDELRAMARSKEFKAVGEQMESLDREILGALGTMGIEEISVPKDPEELRPRFLETLGAAQITENPDEHGQVAEIKKTGYQVEQPDGEPVVIRKALVVRFKSESPADAQTPPAVSGQSQEQQHNPPIQEPSNPTQQSK